MARRYGVRGSRGYAVLGVAVAALGVVAPAWAQNPEERGPLPFSIWDAGSITADGVGIRTRVFHPDSGGPYPLVGVIHGASANGSYHNELASTLASRGFVCVVPDMPCSAIAGCDHDANQRQISALLEWAAARSADGASPVAGRIDGSRRGLIGHSWGGLSSHLTAARDPSIDSLVLFDPNDDGVQGLTATPTIAAPTLQLLAEVPGACNSMWQEANVRAQLVPPNLQFTFNGSGHCDPGENDLVCSFACGAGDRATTPLFRRWAVAWTSCVLTGDPAMATWVDGSEFDAAVGAGTLEGVFESNLGALPCRSGGVGGAPGTGGVGASGGAGGAGAGGSASGSGGAGGAGFGGGPAGAAGSAGAAAGGDPAEDAGGCSCTVPPARRDARWGAFAALLLALARRRAHR